MRLVLPEMEDVSKMLGDLFGRKSQVKKGERVRMGKAPVAVAVYREGSNDDIVCVWMCDMSFGCRAAGALSMLPSQVIDDARKKPTMEENISENLYEIFNIGANLFASEGFRVVLDKVYWPGEEVPVDIAETFTKSKQRLPMNVEIDGYGNGGTMMVIKPEA